MLFIQAKLFPRFPPSSSNPIKRHKIPRIFLIKDFSLSLTCGSQRQKLFARIFLVSKKVFREISEKEMFM
jgi:hypothetical protein